MSSESSKVYLFKWMGEKVNQSSKIYVNAICNAKGFSYFTYSKRNLNQLLNCVDGVIKHVDSNYHDSITILMTWSVSLGFTAQTNLEKSIAIQEDIYNGTLNIANKVQSENKTHQFDVKKLEIMKGVDETLYYWLSVNYELNLNSNHKRSFGVIQMDDVSSSIAYSSEDGEKEVTLFDTKYRVKTTTNMCFGYMTHVQRYLIALIVANNASGHIFDPCLNDGANRTFVATEMKKWRCGEIMSKYDYIKAPGKVYTFIGRPDAKACSALNKKLLDGELCGKVFLRCPFNEKSKPPASMEFIPTAAIKEITSVIHLDESTDKREFQKKTEDYCGLKWSEVVAERRYTHKYEINHCLLLTFVYQFLSEMNSFDDTAWRYILFDNGFNNEEYGTSLGHLLQSQITETSKIVKLSNTSSIIGYLLLILICLIVIYFAIKLLNRSLKSEHKMEIEKQRNNSEKLLLTHKSHDHNQNEVVVLQFE